MSAVLPIYSTEAAPAPMAGWLQRVLQPVLEACRFQRAPPPVQIGPTGEWAGLCHASTFSPDRRVVISCKVAFWSSESIASVYIHEATHRLLEDREVDTHGPEFFCLNAILLIRSAALFRLNWLFKLDFYDYSDCPLDLQDEPNWRGIVVGWSLPTAAELAATDASAEQLADIVCKRWQQFLQERQNARAQAAQQVVAARKNAALQLQKIESLQSSIFVARTFLIVGWLCFLSVCISFL